MPELCASAWRVFSGIKVDGKQQQEDKTSGRPRTQRPGRCSPRDPLACRLSSSVLSFQFTDFCSPAKVALMMRLHRMGEWVGMRKRVRNQVSGRLGGPPGCLSFRFAFARRPFARSNGQIFLSQLADYSECAASFADRKHSARHVVA